MYAHFETTVISTGLVLLATIIVFIPPVFWLTHFKHTHLSLSLNACRDFNARHSTPSYDLLARAYKCAEGEIEQGRALPERVGEGMYAELGT